MFLSDRPLITEVGFRTYLVDCMGMGSGMLFVGDERALLVDTGCGNADLRGMIESFVNVPVLCAVTHEHGDHIGGIGQWQQVYVPALEMETIRNTTQEFLQTFLEFFNSVVDEGDGTAGVFRQQTKLRPWDYEPELIPLYDGDRFDLGGRTVTCYRCQVHSKGHLCFIDDRTRIMFGGDSLSNDTGPASNPMNPPTIVSLEDEVRGLENILRHKDEYDCVWGGHSDWGGNISFIHSFDRDVADRMLAVGRAALAGEIPVFLEEGDHGTRNYAEIGSTRLYFFGQYMRDGDLPEEYRYRDPGPMRRSVPF